MQTVEQMKKKLNITRAKLNQYKKNCPNYRELQNTLNLTEEEIIKYGTVSKRFSEKNMTPEMSKIMDKVRVAHIIYLQREVSRMTEYIILNG